jgi:antitoxin (DNA-binding transcriptional repressor) of toxin-antitoxin stability system
MKFLGIQDLKGKSSQILKELSKEKEMIVISKGKPIAILASITEENIEESLSAFRKARAIEAVVSLQRKSLKQGMEKISFDEINKEIKAVRKKRSR